MISQSPPMSRHVLTLHGPKNYQFGLLLTKATHWWFGVSHVLSPIFPVKIFVHAILFSIYGENLMYALLLCTKFLDAMF